MTDAPILDHMVINVSFDMDRAAAQFSGLGFELTPRGYHSLGSINHLMIYATDYLELLGLPAGVAPGRAEIADAPIGYNGLVFKSTDVDATFAHLKTLGMAGDPPKAFSRPVDIDGEQFDARFRTVSVRPGVFPAGRVYFCEHGTPDLVWRAAWRGHANSAESTAEFLVVAADPEREIERYAQLVGVEIAASSSNRASIDLHGSQVVVLSPAAYRERFGELALDRGEAPSIFGGVSLRCRDLAAAARSAESDPSAYRSRIESDRVVVTVADFGTLLEFR